MNLNLHRKLTREAKQGRNQDKLLDLANIPHRYKECSIDEIPENISYKSKVQKWIDNVYDFVNSGRWLLMHGPYGSGKTAAGIILLREVLLRNGSAFMITQQDLIDAIMRGKGNSFPYSIDKVIGESNILMIDEIGGGKEQDFILEILERVCVARYNNKLSLIMTTNKNPLINDINDPVSIHGFLSGKVLTIIQEVGDIMNVDGHEWRKELGAKK